MEQQLSKLPLIQLCLNLENKKWIESEFNAAMKDQGCNVDLFNLNLDLMSEGDQTLMLPCCCFYLSWEETHRLIDYYDGNLAKIFGEKVNILPEKEGVQFFMPCRGELFPDSLQEMWATVERTVSWPRTVLKPVGLVDKTFTVSIVQMYTTATEFLGKRQ